MMRAPEFRYHAATSVKDAVAALAGEDGAMLLAGGTDLVPNMKRRQQTPALVIGIGRIPALRRTLNGKGLTLGACATLTDVAEHPKVRAHYAALAKAELPDREAWFKRHAWVHSLWVPLGTWVWLFVLLSSVFVRTGENDPRRQDVPRASQAHA